MLHFGPDLHRGCLSSMDCTPESAGVTGSQVESKQKWKDPPSRRQDKSFVSIVVHHICRADNRSPFPVLTVFRGIDRDDLPAYLKQGVDKEKSMDKETIVFLKSLAVPIDGHRERCIGVTDQASLATPLWSVRGVDNYVLFVNMPDHVALY